MKGCRILKYTVIIEVISLLPRHIYHDQRDEFIGRPETERENLFLLVSIDCKDLLI